MSILRKMEVSQNAPVITRVHIAAGEKGLAEGGEHYRRTAGVVPDEEPIESVPRHKVGLEVCINGCVPGVLCVAVTSKLRPNILSDGRY